jgi:hypothetical protein
VVDLESNVSPEAVIAAARQHDARLVGDGYAPDAATVVDVAVAPISAKSSPL